MSQLMIRRQYKYRLTGGRFLPKKILYSYFLIYTKESWLRYELRASHRLEPKTLKHWFSKALNGNFFLKRGISYINFCQLRKVLPGENCHRVLSCLVQMASVRRSLFNNEERQKFLASLVRGISLVLKNGSSLSNLEVYHEFCRLLGRLKANYQLGELTALEEYPEAIRLIVWDSE